MEHGRASLSLRVRGTVCPIKIRKKDYAVTEAGFYTPARRSQPPHVPNTILDSRIVFGLDFEDKVRWIFRG